MHARSFIEIGGPERVTFLQGILTQDIRALAPQRIQFAALLSPQGKVLHDMFLLDTPDAIVIDTRAADKDMLLKRLALYKLRAKVTIQELAPENVAARLHAPLADPRHPDLPPYSPLGATPAPIALGIPELGRDFAPDTLVPLDAGYDLLHAISFTKGCYVGQEVTARMHYKHIARRGFFILSRDGVAERLALLKFDEVMQQQHRLTVDNVAYHAQLPDWMQPKWQQFLRARETQPEN